MRPLALTLLCIMIAAVPLTAQSDSSPGDREYRYVARIIGNNVNVRSRPDVRYGYRCARISAPQTVRVVEEQDEWLKILPPEGCFSVVAADYVDLDEDSGIGRITGDRVRIRSAGELRTTSFNVVQGYLNTGDQVRVIGELSDQQMQWYKIEPPLGAYWYVSADFAERVSEADARPIDRPQPRETTTTDDDPEDPTATEPDEDVDEEVSDEQKAMEAFQAAEEALRETFAKPLMERDLSALKERYQAVDAPAESALEAYVQIRIGQIQDSMERQDAYRAARQLAEQTAERQRQHELTLARLQAETPRVEEVTRYDAEGVLMPSEIFTGEGSTPKRYTLRDTISRRINAYVQSTAGDVDLSRHVGKKVGVFGTRRYDSGLQLHVVEAQRVVVLSDDPYIPRPSRPTVVPRPRPRLTPVAPPEPPADQTPTDDEPADAPQLEPEPDDDANGTQETEEPEATTSDANNKPAPNNVPFIPDAGLEMVTPETRQEASDDRPVPEEEYD